MNIVTRGTGPDVVMLHGWAMNSAIWGAFAERLAMRFRLHLVDLPGHGRNRHLDGPMAPAALAREIAAHTPPAAWLGWSLGGLVAQCAARDLPRRCTAAVVVSGTPSFVRRPHWPHAMAPELLVEFAGTLEADLEATLNRFLVLETLGAENARETLKTLREAVLGGSLPRTHALQAGLVALRDSDLVGDLPGIAVPTLWLGGTHDRLVPPAALHAAAKACRRGHGQVFRGAGHAPFLTRSEGCADTITHWLTSLAESRPEPMETLA